MSIIDLNNFVLSIPHHRFQPNSSIIEVILKMQITIQRQIWAHSSDIRFCRNFIVSQFFSPDFVNSDVLVMCDQDSEIDQWMVEQLVIACSPESPIVGSNMLYRNSFDGKNVNWFLPNDRSCLARESILTGLSGCDGVINASMIGFGLVALHRSALEKMADHYGWSQMANAEVPNLFSEYRLRSPNLDETTLANFLSNKLRIQGIEDEEWNNYWETTLKQIALVAYNNQFPSVVYPETYSFCLRAQKLNIPIKVYLNVRPGHIQEIPSYSIFPIIDKKILPINIHSIIQQNETNALEEIGICL